MRKIMQKSINARNEEAIKALVQTESNRAWGRNNDLSIEERAKYNEETGRAYLSGKLLNNK